MKNLVKHLVFGALLCATVAGVATATARRAEAADVCDPCTPDGGQDGSGYMVASGNGNDLICVAADDTRAAGCQGGS